MKRTKKTQLLFVATVLPLLLAGCTVQYNADHQPVGWLYEYLVVPTQWLLNQIASMFNGNYAIAIVIVSVLVRVVLMPTQFHQMKSMLVQQEKMAVLKPYIAEITARAEQAATPQEKLEIQQEQMDLYKLNNVSLMGGLGSGCLPLLITLPIWSGLYNAILLSNEISSSDFMGIALGKEFVPLAIATAALYYIQSLVSQMGMDEETKKQSRSMNYILPVMMFMMTFQSPAGVGIYFFASALIQILQSWIQNTYLRPKIKAQIDEELNHDNVVLPERKTPSKPAQKATQQEAFAKRQNKPVGRNAGKQNRR